MKKTPGAYLWILLGINPKTKTCYLMSCDRDVAALLDRAEQAKASPDIPPECRDDLQTEVFLLDDRTANLHANLLAWFQRAGEMPEREARENVREFARVMARIMKRKRRS